MSMAEDLHLEEQRPERMTLSIGPHHPATHGVLRVKLELEGETVVKAEPETGFLHTGIEKTAEHLTWNQATTVMDRMDYLSPISNNTGYVMAVEKLLGIEDRIPEKARVTRVILLELNRVASHLVGLGTGGLDYGNIGTPIFWAFELRDRILDIFEHTTGQRMNPSYMRVGGLAYDLPHNFKEMVEDFLKVAPGRIQELKDVMLHNPIFVDRAKGVSVITYEQALRYGLTGRNLRVTGSDYDVRKYYPYLGYENYDFKVPVYTDGDSWSRVAITFDEMFESLKIIRQALDNLPWDDRYIIDDRKLVLPPKQEVKHSMEALIHHFKLVHHGFDVPAGEVYVSIESPRGEIGFYVVSDGGNKPMRVRVRPPSFYAVYSLPVLLEGHLLSDMVGAIATIDPVFGEVDR
ncbi:MAG: NADH-quinone oxidoreductase subunit D [Symbiobacterium thermophilum]|uniref:NADH-quinone oxidoreductase subunit D 1 n=3 Tax=Symbiobacterium thermophilum TaxID=2734 RepID=NUOD1_SYMTH|nr:RecName: Full=NADH-quinone oxidoreductase subunit D 1; AltName: Full=NADH dehydrogenase I subunit D 1; AltName: Full=NDH-1 subunit D 1 [Symbiobacterium thermophilum IAM 14863]MBY6277287.1 NADH-quinone oxidoreductase subunit D [Symbiobacterium thermophilum]BAD40574.1 NADH dehydrogenase I subunit D [Symbiobacterium thermophilum IAM 14863]